jgi:hypothetical protein
MLQVTHTAIAKMEISLKSGHKGGCQQVGDFAMMAAALTFVILLINTIIAVVFTSTVRRS